MLGGGGGTPTNIQMHWFVYIHAAMDNFTRTVIWDQNTNGCAGF